jgi:hypothetical protein
MYLWQEVIVLASLRGYCNGQTEIVMQIYVQLFQIINQITETLDFHTVVVYSLAKIYVAGKKINRQKQ